ncbi:MAG: hypothetical protein AAFV80_04265 [Bacteroidota bacterium]
MEDLIKKLVSNGMNLMSSTIEKVQETIDDLVEKGKVSREEGKKIVDDFLKKSESRRKDFDGKLRETFGSVMDNLPKSLRQELDEVKSRLDIIEAKLGMNASDEESE